MNNPTVTRKQELLDGVRDYLNSQEKPDQQFSIPVSGNYPTVDDIVNVVDCVLGGWFTENLYCKKFSSLLRTFIGTKYSSLTNSGSSANLLAVAACSRLWKDDSKYKVVTSATAFPTTVAPIIQNGFTPVFLDVDIHTLNPTMDDFLGAINDESVAGVIQAHTLGFPFDEQALAIECKKRGIWFIADCCDALGSEIGDSKVGSFADISTFSFFPAHHITTMEGGAVCTSNPDLYRMVERLRNWGRDCFCLPGKDNTCGKRFDHKWKNMPDGYDHKYTFTEMGYNLHMTEPQAALGISQFFRIDSITDARRSNFNFLITDLLDFNDVLIFMQYNDGVLKASPFGFPIIVRKDAPFTKNEIVSFLEDAGIRTRPIFAGNITRQPMFDDVSYLVYSELVNSDFIMENGFWIGLHPEITLEKIDYVVDTFYDFKYTKGF